MSRSRFRLLVLLEWVFLVGGVVSYFVRQPSLPPELRAYLDAQADAPLTTLQAVVVTAALAALAASAVAAVGLYRFRGWGRTLYAACFAAGYALMPFSGPAVEDALTAWLGSAAAALSGSLLALAYFSPVARFFETPPRPNEWSEEDGGFKG